MRAPHCLTLAFLLAIPLPAAGATIRVPSEQPTIGAGMGAASAGDTVLVACGTYHESLVFLEPGVVLRSETGSPECVVIDGDESETVLFTQFADASTAIEGVTVTGGMTTGPGGGLYVLSSDLRISRCVFRDNRSANLGGGAAFQGTSSPTIENCRFVDNVASSGGGLGVEAGDAVLRDCVFEGNRAFQNGAGMLSFGIRSRPVLVGCTFSNNDAGWRGGGITCSVSTVEMTNCTFFGNSAQIQGAGVHCAQAAQAVLDHCIVAFNRVRQAVFCTAASTATLICCDVFKNFAGDWNGCLEGQAERNGNFSADPLFCDRENGVLLLQSGSPCAPTGPCGLVGALGVGCGPVPVEAASWGRIKERYR